MRGRGERVKGRSCGAGAPYQLKRSRKALAGRGVATRDAQLEVGMRDPDGESGGVQQASTPAVAGGVVMMESLILAQDKRWRRALRMQVERGASAPSGGRVSNTYVT